MAVASVHTHGGYTMGILKKRHTHTLLHVFDVAVLRCLSADLVAEEETARVFIGYLRYLE